MYENLFNHSPIEGHLGSLQYFAVTNRGAIKIHVQGFVCSNIQDDLFSVTKSLYYFVLNLFVKEFWFLPELGGEYINLISLVLYY